MSRMLKNTGLFAEYRSLLYISFAKETCIFKHPTNRSHPILKTGCICIYIFVYLLGVYDHTHNTCRYACRHLSIIDLQGGEDSQETSSGGGLECV